MLLNNLVAIIIMKASLSCGVDMFLSLYCSSFSPSGDLPCFFQEFTQFCLSFAVLLNRITS